MNIVIFAAVDFPNGSASTSRVKHIAKILTKAGDKVTVASLQANTKIPYPENVNAAGESENITYIYLSGNTVRPSGLIGAVVDSLKGCIGAAALLVKQRMKKEVDAILFYTPDFFLILPTLMFAKLFRIPVFLELCEIYSVGYIGNFKHRVKVVLAGLTERILPRVCSGTVVISTKIRDKVISEGADPKKIFHLPILVDCHLFAGISRSAIPLLSRKKYFLNSGGLGEKDGVSYLLGGFARVCSEHDDIYLVFTGETAGSRKDDVINEARKLGVADRLIFTGFLARDQLVWAYQHAVALLCCRIAGPFANYGSPTKLCEYLSTGRPVITNEIGDNTLYLATCRNAFIAQVEDCASIAEEMFRVLNHPILAQQVGQEGQRTAEKFFHYERYVSSLSSFLRGVSA